MTPRACRSTFLTLLAGTMLAGVLSPVDADAQTSADSRSTTAGSTSSTPKSLNATKAETVQVTGRSSRTREAGGGLMAAEKAPVAVQTIQRDYIAKQLPSANVQQLISMLPSVNVSQQDSFGLYSGQVNIRGFDQSEVGWTLDGAPLNDVGGGQFYANEVLESEDLQTVHVTPGSVNLDAPVISASAGLVTMTMSNPTPKAGGLLDVSVGSFDTTREFLRLNSGYIGNSGVRAMFAFSHTKGNLWRGPGQAEKFHYDFKMVKDFENGSHTGLTVSYNDQVNDFYRAPSYSNWKAGTAYQTNYLADYSGVNSNGANYYRLHVNPFRNVIAVLPTHLVISPKISIDDSAYFWHGVGNGTGATYLSSSTLSKISEGTTPVSLGLNGASSYIALTPSNQEQFRPGNTLTLHYKPNHHHDIELGWWYEYANLEQWSPYGQVNQSTGVPYNVWGTDALVYTTNGQPYRTRDFLSLSQTNMIFIGDTMKYFNDRLTVKLGFKEAMMTRRMYNYTPGTTYNRNLHTAEPLPQVGISWQFDRKNMIYVSGSTNFKVPSNTSLVDYYGSTGSQTQTGGSSKPEYTIEEEIGYRYTGDLILASVSFFNYNLTNRQQSLSYYGEGNQVLSRTINAGGQTTRGVDVQLSTRPVWHHLRPYATFEYLHSTIDNNLPVTTTSGAIDYLPTAGKIAIRSPKVQAGLGLDYDDGNFWFAAQLKYVGKQYASFMDDNSIPQYITNQVGMGYRFKSFGFLKKPEIQLNMQNLTGAKFRSGVYSFTTNANATTGVYGGTIAGSSPSYYLQVPFSAMVTISTGF